MEVESAVQNLGSDADLAFDPETGFPSIVSDAGPPYPDICGWRELRFHSWDGARWVPHVIDSSPDGCISGPSLAYDSLGTPQVTYIYPLPGDCRGGGELRFASFDGAAWAIETIIQSMGKCSANLTSLAMDPSDVPTLSYTHLENSRQVRFVKKIVP